MRKKLQNWWWRRRRRCEGCGSREVYYEEEGRLGTGYCRCCLLKSFLEAVSAADTLGER